MTDLGFNSVAFADAVRREASRLSGAKVEHKRVIVLCPFHGEKTASAHINIDPASKYLGRLYCFGCKAKKSWAEVAETLGLDQLSGKEFHSEDAPQFFETFYAQNLLGASEEKEEIESDPSLKELEFNAENAKLIGLKDNEWRDFSIEFLSRIDNIRFRKRHFKTDAGWESGWFVRLPVVVNGKERGHSDARLFYDADKPSYLNKKGAWSRAYGLFPFDNAVRLMTRRGLRTMVLVEGQRDALRLLRAGVPAVAILGVSSWSLAKIRLLELAGVDRIVLMMDGDRAGKAASQTIEPQLKEGFNLHVIRLWVLAKKLKIKKLDPGNMPNGILRQLKKLVYTDLEG